MEAIAQKVQKEIEATHAAQTCPTSPPMIQPAAKPSQPNDTCPNCGGMGFLRLALPLSDPQFGTIVTCEHPIHAPVRLSRLRRISQLGARDIKKRLTDLNVTDENKEMITAAQKLICDPWGWLYIWGGPGNAKTEVLMAIVNEVNLSGSGPAVYTTLGQILEWMRQAYQDDSQESDYLSRFDHLKQIRLLAIDEMEKPRETEWVDDFRFHFLDDRYRSALNGETTTVFAGNTDPTTFKSEIYDRIRDGRFNIVHNPAPSARPNMKRVEVSL